MISYILTLDKQLLYGIGFQLIATIVLCAILSFILYKPILNFLNKRKERIETQVNEANKKMFDVETLKTNYEEKLKEINEKSNSILDEVRSRAKRDEAEIIANAKREAEAIKQRANLDIKREKEKAKDEIRTQIIEVSSIIASKLVSKTIDESEQNKLVNDVIKDLGEIKWQN